MPVLDFSDVKGLEAIPEGTYRCTFADAEKKKGDKGDFYKVKFTVTDDEDEYNGRSVIRNYSLSPKSLWAFKNLCLALGADADDFAGEVDTDEMLIGLKGAECDVTVTIRQFEDRDVNNIEKVVAPGF